VTSVPRQHSNVHPRMVHGQIACRLLATIPCKTFVLPLYNHNKRHNQSGETIILSAGLYRYKTRAQLGPVGKSRDQTERLPKSAECPSLTPWSRILLEKLTGSQLVKKFSAFYRTRRFVTVFTSARHLFLS